MDRSRVAYGAWGEERVARWYGAAGYDLLDRNWQTATGELDLVLGRGDEIVFCEVKARRTSRYGAPVEAVDHRKQRRVRRLAAEWLRSHRRHGSVRFDVAAVQGTSVVVVEAAF